MKAEFWHAKWQEKSIGFHQQEINPYLQKHLEALELEVGAQLFVPLCGKSRDMAWLAQQGFRVTGIELSEIAVTEFFAESGQVPQISNLDELRCFHGDNIKLLCGDFFALRPDHLPGISAIYDRAALIALPDRMRADYVEHLARLVVPNTKMLLITLEYPQHEMQGPPFCVPADEVRSLFRQQATVKLLQAEYIEFKEMQCVERVWLIQW